MMPHDRNERNRKRKENTFEMMPSPSSLSAATLALKFSDNSYPEESMTLVEIAGKQLQKFVLLAAVF